MSGISELYMEVVGWAVANGATRIDMTPGIWVGETSDYTVKVNPHDEEIDGLEFGQMSIEHKTLFAKIAVLFPSGGQVVGVTEDDLIEHFRAERLKSEAVAS